MNKNQLLGKQHFPGLSTLFLSDSNVIDCTNCLQCNNASIKSA